jgi:hypothetical protein
MKEAHRYAVANCDQQTTVASFYFNGRGSELERTPIGLYRSFLYQLLQADRVRLSRFLPIYQSKIVIKSRTITWSLEELRAFFKSTLSNASKRKILFFVDGLDECNQTNVRAVVEDFRSWTDTAFAIGTQLSLCVSSRHYPTITIPRCPELVVQEHNNEDIIHYVREKLKSTALASSTTIRTLEDKILRKAAGVFLWVILVVETVRQGVDSGASAEEMETNLNNIPEELEDIFSKLFETIPNRDKPTSIALVQWCLVACSPLKPMEIHAMVSFSGPVCPESLTSWATTANTFYGDDHLVRRIRYYSRGLIEVIGEIVQFIHETVRDFFLHGKGLKLLDDQLSTNVIGQSQALAIQTCMNVMETALRDGLVSQRPIPRSVERELCVYSTSFMFEHLASLEFNSASPEDMIRRLWTEEYRLWFAWHKLALLLGPPFGGDISLIHHLCAKKLWSSAKSLLTLASNPNEISAENLCPIHTAIIAEAPLTFVATLIEAGALVDAQDGSGQTPLHYATKAGNRELVLALLSHSANPVIPDYTDRTPLHSAAEGSHFSLLSAMLVHSTEPIKLQDGAISMAFDLRDSLGRTPLHIACQRNEQEMVDLLLTTGANPSITNNREESVLDVALRACHTEVADILVKAGANASEEDPRGNRDLLTLGISPLVFCDERSL